MFTISAVIAFAPAAVLFAIFWPEHSFSNEVYLHG